jgi:branched-subunit amino acid transport protein
VSTQLILLAVLMGAVTYPSRGLPLLAPGIDRLPPLVREYLRLVGPAILANIAALEVMVRVDAQRHPSIHVGIELLAVGVCVALVAARRGLLVGTVVAALIAALARTAGLA